MAYFIHSEVFSMLRDHLSFQGHWLSGWIIDAVSQGKRVGRKRVLEAHAAACALQPGRQTSGSSPHIIISYEQLLRQNSPTPVFSFPFLVQHVLLSPEKRQFGKYLQKYGDPPSLLRSNSHPVQQCLKSSAEQTLSIGMAGRKEGWVWAECWCQISLF